MQRGGRKRIGHPAGDRGVSVRDAVELCVSGFLDADRCI